MAGKTPLTRGKGLQCKVMPLPVLHAGHHDSPAALLRQFHQAEARWCQHLAEEEQLEVGTAYANPQLAQVYDANNIRDVALPEGMTAAQAYEQVASYYQNRGVRCAYWTMNPSAPESRTRPMVEHLLSLGYRAESAEILLLGRTPQAAVSDAGLKIIPARASFRHTRLLAEDAARQWNAPQLADARMLHLDDPHWDALLALKEQTPVAYIGVLSVGEIGLIEHAYVAEAYRRLGIGRIMLSRALEICARSLFKHVMLSVLPGNAPAQALYRGFGFHPIGQITGYYPADVTLTS